MAGKKLLVADDSLTIQKVIRLALSNEGYEIQAVSEGNDAVQQISLFRPDVILIDVSLPGKSAFEVKREINTHEDLSEIRFVLMSSAFEKVDEKQAEEVKFHGQLTKPFDPAHLRQVLTDVLAQVTARRTEKTSLIAPPAPPPSGLPSDELPEFLPDLPPPLPENFSENENDLDLPPLNTPTIEDTDEFPPPPPDVLRESTVEEWSSSVPSPPTQDFKNDSDIKELTEITIQDSGLDDYPWKVNDPTPPPLPSISLPDTPLATSTISPDIEGMIQKEVQLALEKMAQKLLPEVAERVIKQEIHRLLSES